MNGRQERINLKLYDIYDGLFKNITDKDTVPEALIKNNQSFWQNEIEHIQEEKFDKVIICNGGIAQDIFAYKDPEPGTHHALRLGALPVIQSYLDKNVTPDVVLDPFWMSDIYGGKSAGEGFLSALREYFSGAKTEQHSRAVIDHSRISIIYALAHRAADLNPGAQEIVLDYYYDMIPRISSLNTFFDRRQAMLPSNVTLRLHHIDRNAASHRLAIIPTIGTTDKHYEWSVRYLESQHYSSFSRVPDNNRNIQNANELAAYHFADNVYHGRDRKGTMEINENFRNDKFLDFRDNEIANNLGDVSMLGHQLNYTTAKALWKQGCLPAKFVLDMGINKHAAATRPAPAPASATPVPTPVTAPGVQPAPIPAVQPVPLPVVTNPAPAAQPVAAPVTTLPVNAPVVIQPVPAAQPVAAAQTAPAPQTVPAPAASLPTATPAVQRTPSPAVVRQRAELTSAQPVSSILTPPAAAGTPDTQAVQMTDQVKDRPATPVTAPPPDPFLEGLNVASGDRENTDNDFIIEDPEGEMQATFQLEPAPSSAPSEAAPVEQTTDDSNQLMVLDESDSSQDLPQAGNLVRTGVFLGQQNQNESQKIALDYINSLYKLYANSSDNFSITTFIRTLRNSSQVHRLTIPRDFNPLEAVKEVARLKFWNNMGSSFNYFSGKTPAGITEINSKNSSSLAELVKQLKEYNEQSSSSYFHGRRQPLTSDFYDMILTFCEDRMDDQVRYVAINAFLRKWKVSGYDLPMDVITPAVSTTPTMR